MVEGIDGVVLDTVSTGYGVRIDFAHLPEARLVTSCCLSALTKEHQKPEYSIVAAIFSVLRSFSFSFQSIGFW
jgi:hypothetical protein